MKSNITSATGIGWLRDSWKILKAYPIPMLGIVGFYFLLLLCASTLGVLVGIEEVGIILGSIVTPFGTVAFAAAGREISNNQRPNLVLCYMEGWKNLAVRNKLILLGMIYGLCVIGNGFLMNLLAKSSVEQWKVVNGVYDLSSITANIPWAAIVVCGIFYALILCVTCFSPLLVAWRNQPIGKAFFFSLFVCLRNIIPILALGCALFFIAFAGIFVTQFLSQALGFLSILTFLWGYFISAWFYSALWPMWVTFFGAENSRI